MALTDNLISYWKYDEPSGDAADSSGNSKTLTNNNTATYVDGKIANATDLERGSSQFFSRANGTYYDGTSGTINCWVNYETLTSVLTIFDNTVGGGGGTKGLDIRIEEDQSISFYFGDGNNECDGATALSAATWYMVTCTWDTSGKQVFINGVLDGVNTTDETLTAGAATIYVGNRGGIAENFDGLIDEFGFWSRVLTSDEISTLYNAGDGLTYPFDITLLTSLQAAYKLDEPSGDAADSSGNGYTLTNTNSVGYAAGKINNAADTGVANTNEKLATTSFLGLSASQPYTFNFWVNVTTQATSGNEVNILSWCNNSTAGGRIFYQIKTFNNSGTQQVYINRNNVGAGTQVGANNTFTAETWYMLTNRWDGATHTLCINGNTTPLLTQASAIVGTSTNNSGTDGFKLFTAQDNTTYFAGLIDIVSVYSRSITDAEMIEHYNSGAGIQYPFTSAGPSNMKTYNTNPIANIKTMNTNAIANVKTFDTNA